jgi:hypothetical protein
MRELIDRGYIYIAQAPLYKVTRGKSEQYLKNEHALEDYLTDMGLEDAVFRPYSGDERAGPDLKAIVEEARSIRNVLSGLHSRYNRRVVEQAAIASVLRSAIFGDLPKAIAAAEYIAKRLDALSEETERGWQGSFEEGDGFRFERTVRGVKEVSIIDHALLASADARKLDEHAASLQDIYMKPGVLGRRPQGYLAAALQGPRRDEPAAAVGDDARHQRALAAAGEGARSRRGRRHLHQADGRYRRAAARVHPGERAGGKRGCVRRVTSFRPFRTTLSASHPTVGSPSWRPSRARR